MKNNLSIDIPAIGKGITRFLYRFHFVLFIVVVLGGLAVVILLLNQTLTRASDTNNAAPITLTPFDRQTIDMLNQLNTSSGETRDLEFPDGRINPFSE